ncbi:SDR family oxidoreductase [Aerococcus urinae]|uniref:SDR family oxidoreductase n=1 Tax=Aerococcus mictus TaxID=2976810 RepID=A0A1E9PPW2_9LACT|nr:MULTISPECIES: SDR family oxidoreductase [Aerococcus]KAA9293594.1 SDR family oxidoreductase [Aerococcus mictus]MBU5609858.1 SDR family oxidoreductase [Aerococcus urinae]MCY3033859.1 SDR family oxidoreductase [Aerococcus mictus]MCY3063148.1 SDR family oxidoreductase [Aerococcus mictus]MCY3065163.1 SDR family oxidoreductase [Aerococcus mictus]
MNIQGKVVIVTGAASGIGQATAYLLAEKGAKVIVADLDANRAQEVSQAINAKGGDSQYFQIDVTSYEANQKLVDFSIEKYGHLDASFLCAGIMQLSRLSDIKVEEWDRQIDINLKGVMYGIAAAMPVFKEQKAGHLLTVSSIAGLHPFIDTGAYCASKWGVRVFMEVIRRESADEGTNIRTTTLYPGDIDTNLTAHTTDAAIKAGLEKVYEEVAIPADRVAQAIAFAIGAPADANVSEITIFPTKQVI